MSKTKIEWADAVWNPVTGCTKVSEGCRNCYAARMAPRLAGRFGYPADDPFRVTCHPDRLSEPLKWKSPKRIFVCSMGDLFHEDVPFEFIDEVIGRMISDDPDPHTFMILTKRPERMHEYFSEAVKKLAYEGFPASYLLHSHLWLGVSVEDQATADERVPWLLKIPAAVRFVSYEPALGPIDLTDCINLFDWVIAGGESGPGARPCHPDWIRSVRDECALARVPFFFKQWGAWLPVEPLNDVIYDCPQSEFTCGDIPDGNYKWHDWDNYRYSLCVGKKKTGRILDGMVWDQIPGGWNELHAGNNNLV